MSARETVDQWLAELASVLGSGLKLDEDGTINLQFKEDRLLAIEVPSDGDYFMLYAPLCPVPDDPALALELFQGALHRNLFQTQTLGGAIGLDPDGGMLFYSLSRAVATFDAPQFAAQVAQVLELIPTLREWLNADLADGRAMAAMAQEGEDAADKRPPDGIMPPTDFIRV